MTIGVDLQNLRGGFDTLLRLDKLSNHDTLRYSMTMYRDEQVGFGFAQQLITSGA